MSIDANKNNKPDIDYDDKRIDRYICHARGGHDLTGSPNGKVDITSNNRSNNNNELKNGQKDAANPKKEYRVA